jgi:hypothetical protein
LQQELVLAGVEETGDLGDRRALIVGEAEALTGLDEFVRDGDRVGIGVDRVPDRCIGW